MLSARVRFVARGTRQAVFATDDGVRLAFEPSANRRLALALTFAGASPALRAEAAAPDAARVNYFSGGDPSRWRTNIPTFHEIQYRNVWRGVDASIDAH